MKEPQGKLFSIAKSARKAPSGVAQESEEARRERLGERTYKLTVEAERLINGMLRRVGVRL